MHLIRAYLIGLLFVTALFLIPTLFVHLGQGYAIAAESVSSGELSFKWALGLALLMTGLSGWKIWTAVRVIRVALSWRSAAT